MALLRHGRDVLLRRCRLLLARLLAAGVQSRIPVDATRRSMEAS